MNQITWVKKWVESHYDVVLDIIRIYLGIGLFFKGIYFLTHSGELARLIDGSGTLWALSAIVAHYVVVANIVGGFCLALGLLTRAAALLQLPVLFGAVFYVHLPRIMSFGPRQDLEFAGLVLFLLALIGVYGAGRWSLDYYLERKSAEAAPSAA